MLLYGESRFLSVCDFKRLGVAKRSPGTTFTLEADNDVRAREGKAARLNWESRHAAPWMFRDRVARHYRLSHCIILFIPSLPATDKDAGGLPVLQQASMPRQRLRSILYPSKSAKVVLASNAIQSRKKAPGCRVRCRSTTYSRSPFRRTVRTVRNRSSPDSRSRRSTTQRRNQRHLQCPLAEYYP